MAYSATVELPIKTFTVTRKDSDTAESLFLANAPGKPQGKPKLTGYVHTVGGSALFTFEVNIRVDASNDKD